jgi:hypothetical protein
MKVIRTKIGFVKGGKGDTGDPGPPWLGGPALIEQINELDQSVNARIQIVDSIYIRKDARGSPNGVAELDGNGIIPDFRLPDFVAWVGGEMIISFENLIGKTIVSGIYNEEEGWLEC